ncbi:hypothetical protein EB62_01303 [Enterococcus faecalis]|nr:hypothetical protein EA75_00670 [Enterococcus faecalis]RBR87544.1 hypothetical protein EB55_01315 [Enterococcus faecalis]RBR95236.1 hypothetical protein EB62_01303 [Enterococcus faecalis]
MLILLAFLLGALVTFIADEPVLNYFLLFLAIIFWNNLFLLKFFSVLPTTFFSLDFVLNFFILPLYFFIMSLVTFFKGLRKNNFFISLFSIPLISWTFYGFYYSYSTNSSAIYWLLAKILICVLCIYFFLIEYKKQKSCNHGPE